MNYGKEKSVRFGEGVGVACNWYCHFYLFQRQKVYSNILMLRDCQGISMEVRFTTIGTLENVRPYTGEETV